jgi:hypothetical protein
MLKNYFYVIFIVILSMSVYSCGNKPITMAENSAVVELDGDANGGIDIDKGGTNATTDSGARTALGLAIGSDVQAYDADLDTWSLVTPSANGQSLVSAADYAAMKALLDLEVGTDVLAPDGDGSGLTGLSLSQFDTQTAWRVFYSNADGDVTELALGAAGTYFKSNGASSAPTFDTPSGSGDVSKVGTPANGEVGVWTGDGTLEGQNEATFKAQVNLEDSDINTLIDAKIDDTAYNSTSWDANTDAPTKNAVRDKIESLAGGHDELTLDASATTGGLSLIGQALSNQAATNSQNGYMTSTLVGNIEANNAKNTNISTSLSMGTVGVSTIAITSDGGADDVTLPAGTNAAAGVITAANVVKIEANDTDTKIANRLLDEDIIWTGEQTFQDIILPANGVTNAAMADNSIDSDEYVDGSIDIEHMSTNSVDYDNTTGSIKALTPVVDAAADFAANFTGANLYGGTFICDTTGTIQLPAVASGMNFTIITKGAIAISADTNASDLMMLDGEILDDGDKATNTSTAGDIIVFQYMDATGWVATSNGWTDGGA